MKEFLKRGKAMLQILINREATLKNKTLINYIQQAALAFGGYSLTTHLLVLGFTRANGISVSELPPKITRIITGLSIGVALILVSFVLKKWLELRADCRWAVIRKLNVMEGVERTVVQMHLVGVDIDAWLNWSTPFGQKDEFYSRLSRVITRSECTDLNSLTGLPVMLNFVGRKLVSIGNFVSPDVIFDCSSGKVEE